MSTLFLTLLSVYTSLLVKYRFIKKVQSKERNSIKSEWEKTENLKKNNKAALKFNAYLTSVKGGYFNSACPPIVILCDYSYYLAEIFVHLLQTVKE